LCALDLGAFLYAIVKDRNRNLDILCKMVILLRHASLSVKCNKVFVYESKVGNLLEEQRICSEMRLEKKIESYKNNKTFK
jgi:hypothetical protein